MSGSLLFYWMTGGRASYFYKWIDEEEVLDMAIQRWHPWDEFREMKRRMDEMMWLG